MAAFGRVMLRVTVWERPRASHHPHSSPQLSTFISDGFYARAIKLQDQLLGARRKGLESNKYEDALRSVLKQLHELVGQR